MYWVLILFFVVMFAPMFYKINKRIGELEDEIRDLKNRSNRF